MSNPKTILFVATLCLIAMSLNAVSLNSKLKSMVGSSSEDSSDPNYKAVCISSDREKKNCNNTVNSGCLCYNNGTCINTYVNRCKNCSNEDVFSVLSGQQCPSSQPYLCEPLVAGVRYTCVQETYTSCVCTLNGTCSERNASHCIDCWDPSNLAVFENKNCPAKYLQTPPSKYFIPKLCVHTGATSISCLATQTPGCVCYSTNNTCEYKTDSNRCLLCFSQDVASFNQGEYCPTLNGQIYICDGSDSSNNCVASDTISSCVCSSNGTCSEKTTNHCKGCANKNIVDVIEGGSCPLAHFIVNK